MVVAVAGWAFPPLEVAEAPPLEVAGAPPLEVVVPVMLGAMFLGLPSPAPAPAPATPQRDHEVARWPRVG